MRKAKEIRAEIKRLKELDEQTWSQWVDGEVSQRKMEEVHHTVYQQVKALEWVLNEEVQK